VKKIRKTIRILTPDGVFSEGGFFVFCGGFLKKRVVGRGFLMVNLWWKRGDL
jgi:hypothetical protein